MAAHAALLVILLAATPPDTTPQAPIEPPETAALRLTTDESDEMTEELFAHREWVREHPLDLNSITKEELTGLSLISSTDARRILAYRDSVGAYRAVEDLLQLDPRLFHLLHPYVHVPERLPARRGRSPGFGSLRVHLHRTDLTPFPEEQGAFEGSLWKTYARLTVKAERQVSCSVMFEKDAGEKARLGFVSGFLQVDGFLGGSDLILGDYTLETGSGLTVGRGSWIGRGADPVGATDGSGPVARGHRSASESTSLRGLWLALRTGRIRPSLFVSFRSLAASLDEGGRATSLYDEGLFRTASEIRRRNAANELILGARMEYTITPRLSAGATMFRLRRSVPLSPEGPHRFRGQSLIAGGLDLRADLSTVFLRADLAGSDPGKFAGLVSAKIAAGPGAVIGVSVREFSPDYWNPHARTVGQTETGRNERGFSLGCRLSPVVWAEVFGSLDVTRPLWRPATLNSASLSQEMIFSVRLTLNRWLIVLSRFKEVTQEHIAALPGPYGRTVAATCSSADRSFRLGTTMEAAPGLVLESRVEIRHRREDKHQPREQGILLFQGFTWRCGPQLAMEGRMILFDTDSYATRVYQLERDVSGAFTVPTLYGTGYRWYLIVRATLWAFQLSGKVARTIRRATPDTASSDARTSDEHGTSITVQLDIKV